MAELGGIRVYTRSGTEDIVPDQTAGYELTSSSDTCTCHGARTAPAVSCSPTQTNSACGHLAVRVTDGVQAEQVIQLLPRTLVNAVSLRSCTISISALLSSFLPPSCLPASLRGMAFTTVSVSFVAHPASAR